MDTTLARIKRDFHDRLHAITAGADVRDAYHPEADWWGSHPFNERKGTEAIDAVRSQLRKAIPDVERDDSLFVAGRSLGDPRPESDPEGDIIVAWMGHYRGTFREPLVGIPPTGEVVHLRCCEAHRICDDHIIRSHVLFDFLDLMRQAGHWPISPSLGREGLWPRPKDGDGSGTALGARDRSHRSIETVLAMHGALAQFDGRNLDSMPHGQYWTPDFLWCGPAGIGITQGMEEFRAHHQIPFLTGFRDRRGAGHYMRIGDGEFAVTGGWPSVVATHTGEWLGLGATGKRVAMRVMDFYRLDNGLIAQNWIPIDIIHVLLQLGVDVFSRLRHLTGNPAMDFPE
ncbi:MAG: ester cyclase [Paracoccaceae bacterium]|nr:ester cyclase [Paracoccaceae bacterium]